VRDERCRKRENAQGGSSGKAQPIVLYSSHPLVSTLLFRNVYACHSLPCFSVESNGLAESIQ
jgi:hypothetical protein